MKITHLIALSLALALPAVAEELKGEATCAKCNLKTADKCTLALTVEKDGKKETYLAEPSDAAKGFHKQICMDTKQVKAEGTLSEKDGKKVVTLTKIEAQ